MSELRMLTDVEIDEIDTVAPTDFIDQFRTEAIHVLAYNLRVARETLRWFQARVEAEFGELTPAEVARLAAAAQARRALFDGKGQDPALSAALARRDREIAALRARLYDLTDADGAYIETAATMGRIVQLVGATSMADVVEKVEALVGERSRE